MNRKIEYVTNEIIGSVSISGSKSESNRLLILQNIFPNIQLKNLSDSDDSKHLIKALNSKSKTIDIGHAGTAMRFLTAYFAVIEGREVILTGSNRMQNRPIKILVEALQSIGADVQYVDKVGFPPLLIKGKTLTNNKVKINGNVSSQYISALLLIACSLKNGLEIELVGKVTSVPYLKMTLALLKDLDVETTWKDSLIKVKPKKQIGYKIIAVESDWSSASYFYSLVALSENAEITLTSFKQDSLQGDRSLVEIYNHFGVKTEFGQDSIKLSKISKPNLNPLNIDLINSPDLAQTIAVTCFGLGITCNLKGLHTLKIKETDRLVALYNELTKLGAHVEVTDESLHLAASKNIKRNVSIDTYHDHRMAMAFAPLAIKVPMTINDSEVVTKSFTSFWSDFESVLK